MADDGGAFGSFDPPDWPNQFLYEPQDVYSENEKQRTVGLFQSALDQLYRFKPPSTAAPQSADTYNLNLNWNLPPPVPSSSGGGGFWSGVKDVAGTALGDVGKALGAVRENTTIPAEGLGRILGQGDLPHSYRDLINAGHESEQIQSEHLPVGADVIRRGLTDPLTYAGPGLLKGALRFAPEAVQGSKAASIALGLLDNPIKPALSGIAGAGAAAQFGPDVPGFNRLPPQLQQVTGGLVGGLTPAAIEHAPGAIAKIRGSILTDANAPIAAAVRKGAVPSKYQQALFGNENTVKQPDLFGGVTDTGKTETELNGWQPGQPAPALNNPPATTATQPPAPAGQRSIFDVLGGDAPMMGVAPKRAAQAARETEQGGNSVLQMRAPQIGIALGKTPAEIKAMTALDNAVKDGTAVPEEVAYWNKIRGQWTDEYKAANQIADPVTGEMKGRAPVIVQAPGTRAARYAALDQEAADFPAREAALRSQGAGDEFIAQEKARIQAQQDQGSVGEAVGRTRLQRVLELEKIASDPSTPPETAARAREVIAQEHGATLPDKAPAASGDPMSPEVDEQVQNMFRMAQATQDPDVLARLRGQVEDLMYPSDAAKPAGVSQDTGSVSQDQGGGIGTTLRNAYMGAPTPINIGARALSGYLGARLQGDDNETALSKAALGILPNSGLALRNLLRDSPPQDLQGVLAAVKKGGGAAKDEGPPLAVKTESIPVDRPTVRPDLFQARDVPEGLSYDPAKVANIKETYNPANRTPGLLARDVNTGEEVVVSGHHRAQVDKEMLAEGTGPASTDWRVVTGDLKDPAFVNKLKEMAVTENYQTAETGLKSDVNAYRQLESAGNSPRDIQSKLRISTNQSADNLGALASLPDPTLDRLSQMPKASQDAAAMITKSARDQGLNESNRDLLLKRYVFEPKTGVGTQVIQEDIRKAAAVTRALQGSGVEGQASLFNTAEYSNVLDVLDQMQAAKREAQSGLNQAKRDVATIDRLYPAGDDRPYSQQVRQEAQDALQAAQAKFDESDSAFEKNLLDRFQSEGSNKPAAPSEPPAAPFEAPTASMFGDTPAPDVPGRSAAALPETAPATEVPPQLGVEPPKLGEAPPIPTGEGMFGVKPLGDTAAELTPEEQAARGDPLAPAQGAPKPPTPMLPGNPDYRPGADITEALPLFGDQAGRSTPEEQAAGAGRAAERAQAMRDAADAARRERLAELPGAPGTGDGTPVRPMEGEYPLFGGDATQAAPEDVAARNAAPRAPAPDPALAYTDAERLAARNAAYDRNQAPPTSRPAPGAPPGASVDDASAAWNDLQDRAGVAGTPGTPGNPIASDRAGAGPALDDTGRVAVPSNVPAQGTTINKAVDVATQASRVAFTLMTSGHPGFAFLQNYFTLFSNPGLWASSMAKAVAAGISPSYREGIRQGVMDSIDSVAKGTPWEGKLSQVARDEGGLAIARSEAEMSTDLGVPLLERAPGAVGAYFRGNRRALEAAVEPSRGEAFAHQFQNLVASGKEPTLDDIKAMAAHANHLTGTTKIGLDQRAAIAFGAPRFMMANFALIGDAFHGGAGAGFVRTQLAKSIGVAASVAIAANIAESGGKDWFGPGLGNPSDIIHADNPAQALAKVLTSSNFGRIRVNGADLSPFGPLDPIARTFFKEMVASAGAATELAGKDPGTAIPGKASFQFLQNKASPLLRLITAGVQGGDDYTGAVYHNPWDYVKDNWSTVMPIFSQNVMDAVNGNGSWSDSIASFWGLKGSPTTASERATSAVNGLPDKYWVTDAKTQQLRPPNSVWELTPQQRAGVRVDHPAIDKYLRQQETSPSMPDSAKFTNYVKANQTLDDSRLQGGELSTTDWRQKFQDRNSTLRDTRAQQWPDLAHADPTTQAQSDLNEYFKMFNAPANHQNNDLKAPVDSDLIDQATSGLQSALGPDRWGAVEQQLGWSDSPVVRQYLADMQAYHTIRGTVPKYYGMTPDESKQADQLANKVIQMQQSYPGTPQTMIISNLLQSGQLHGDDIGKVKAALDHNYTYAYNQWRYSAPGQQALSWFKNTTLSDIQSAQASAYQAHASSTGGAFGSWG